jgi:hypothetical protein
MAPNAQTPAEKLAAIFTGLKNRNADVRVQNAKELRRFVGFESNTRHYTCLNSLLSL